MLDLLEQMATTNTTKAKKDAKPDVRDDALDKVLDGIIEAKRQIESQEAILTTLEDQARTTMRPVLTQICRQDRKIHASVRVNGKMTYTSQCRYSKVPSEHKATLVEAFGDEFKRFFSSALEISLTPAAAADESFLQSLIKAVGDIEFMKRFKVTRTLTVTEAFHTAVTLDEKVAAKAAPFISAEIIKQATPSFRV